jgi:Protein of unknown function (DUF3307)
VITADQLLAHALGDYVLQSDWMATEKTKKSFAALCHVLTYALPFLFLRPSIPALVFIVSTHFVIDRWRLARLVVWAKNFLAPPSHNFDINLRFDLGHEYRLKDFARWEACRLTGYPEEKPDYFAWWLLIIADNIMHVICNGLALHYLR